MRLYPNLRAELTRKGMTLKDLASHLSISSTHLSEKLNGKFQFKQSEIDTILKIVDKPYEEIFLRS